MNNQSKFPTPEERAAFQDRVRAGERQAERSWRRTKWLLGCGGGIVLLALCAAGYGWWLYATHPGIAGVPPKLNSDDTADYTILRLTSQSRETCRHFCLPIVDRWVIRLPKDVVPMKDTSAVTTDGRPPEGFSIRENLGIMFRLAVPALQPLSGYPDFSTSVNGDGQTILRLDLRGTRRTTRDADARVRRFSNPNFNHLDEPKKNCEYLGKSEYGLHVFTNREPPWQDFDNAPIGQRTGRCQAGRVGLERRPGARAYVSVNNWTDHIIRIRCDGRHMECRAIHSFRSKNVRVIFPSSQIARWKEILKAVDTYLKTATVEFSTGERS